MSCNLPTYLKNKYTADLTRTQSQIEKIETALDKALENSEVEEYKFSDSEGSQMTVRRSPKELMSLLDELEARELRLLKKLNGDTIKYMNMRRKKYENYRIFR